MYWRELNVCQRGKLKLFSPVIATIKRVLKRDDCELFSLIPECIHFPQRGNSPTVFHCSDLYWAHCISQTACPLGIVALDHFSKNNKDLWLVQLCSTKSFSNERELQERSTEVWMPDNFLGLNVRKKISIYHGMCTKYTHPEFCCSSWNMYRYANLDTLLWKLPLYRTVCIIKFSERNSRKLRINSQNEICFLFIHWLQNFVHSTLCIFSYCFCKYLSLSTAVHSFSLYSDLQSSPHLSNLINIK